MPFASKKQQRFLFARKPKVAKKMVKDARRRHQPLFKKSRKRK